MLGIDTSKKLLLLSAAQAFAVFAAAICVTIAYVDYRALSAAVTGAGADTGSVYYFVSLGLMVAAVASILGITIPLMRKSKGEADTITNMAKSFERQAVTDALTELPNRRYFENAFEAYLKEFNAVGKSLGLLVLDLDFFKSVNDNYGHDIGDLVLREVALRLHAITRSHDIVARLGGEEFAVVAPFTNHEQLLSIAERYRSNIESLKVDIGNLILRPTVSIGVATNEGDNIDIHEMFKRADHKLYEAKNSGRNRVAA